MIRSEESIKFPPLNTSLRTKKNTLSALELSTKLRGKSQKPFTPYAGQVNVVQCNRWHVKIHIDLTLISKLASTLNVSTSIIGYTSICFQSCVTNSKIKNKVSTMI